MYSFFNGWAIFHCVYVPQLSYPFICWWTSRLLPCPGYYKQCCDEHWGTHVSSNSGFLSVYVQQWDCWVIWQFYFQFFKESPHCSHSGCTSLQPTNSLRGFPFLHTLSSIVCRLFDDVHSDWHKMVPHSGFDFHFSNNEQCRASVYSVQFSSVTQ